MVPRRVRSRPGLIPGDLPALREDLLQVIVPRRRIVVLRVGITFLQPPRRILIGHPRPAALIGARQWIPREHIDDPVRSLKTGLPLDLAFRTKGQLATGICKDAAGDGVTFDFACADEVYGSCRTTGQMIRQGPSGQP